MGSTNAETSWTPPGLPAPGPGEPSVETLISVARGIARGAPWSVVAESRDLDFEEVRLWPWKFPILWKAYYRKALALQREELAARSLNNLEAIQNSGTLDEIRRAAESLLRYDTMMGLLEKQSSEQLSVTGSRLPVTRERAGSGEDDERTFLPRLPVLMPRGPNRTPRRPSGKRNELPTPEAIAVLRQQLADPDPDIAHRAARTTLMHDARMYSLEMRWGDAAFAYPPGSPDSDPDGEQLPVASSRLSVRDPVSGPTVHAKASVDVKPRPILADMSFPSAENKPTGGAGDSPGNETDFRRERWSARTPGPDPPDTS